MNESWFYYHQESLPVSHSAQAQQLHKGSEDGNGREKEKNDGYDGSGEEGEFSNIDAKGLDSRKLATAEDQQDEGISSPTTEQEEGTENIGKCEAGAK